MVISLIASKNTSESRKSMKSLVDPHTVLVSERKGKKVMQIKKNIPLFDTLTSKDVRLFKSVTLCFSSQGYHFNI